MEQDANLRFHQAEPGAEGGSGGGGSKPAPESGLPPLPSASSREKIYDLADAAPAPDSPTDAGEPAKKEAPPAGKPDSAAPEGGKEAAKKGEEGKPVDPEKRMKDTQAAYHKSREELASEKAKNEELSKKVALYEKYVDPEKLAEHDKAQEEAELDKPLTKRELRDKEEAEKKAKSQAEEAERIQKFTDQFVKDNPHVAPYLESGEAKGVYEKAAMKIWDENPSISQVDLMEAAGKVVAEHFRKTDEAKRAQVAQELTTRRESLSQGRTPPSGGQPGSGSDDADPGDDPGAEIARRHAIRSRVFRPTL